MIKINFLSDYPFSISFGGKEIQMLDYIKYLNQLNDIEVDLLNIWNKDQKYDIIHFFGHNSFYNLIKIIRINKPGIRIVISPTFYYNTDIMHNKIVFKIGSLIPFSNYYNNILYELRCSDAIVVNSKAEKEYILNVIKSNNSKFISNNIFIIYNGVDDEFNIINKDQKNCFLKKYNLSYGEYILSVSFIDERKNTLNMIKSFLSTYNITKKKLVIIGDYRSRNSNYINEIKRIIENNKDKILHIRYIDKLKDKELLKSAYNNCAYHLMPSFIETPGLSNLEAMYFGKNIIVGKCKPVEEYFKENAIYCNPKRMESISEAIKIADKRPFKNEKNIDYIKENYLYSKIVRDLLVVYSILCK